MAEDYYLGTLILNEFFDQLSDQLENSETILVVEAGDWIIKNDETSFFELFIILGTCEDVREEMAKRNDVSLTGRQSTEGNIFSADSNLVAPISRL